MQKKFTKIVASVSDLRCDVSFIQQLYDEGMNVVRMNSAHLDDDGAKKIVQNTRAVSNKIALLMDTKGPEVRTTKMEDGKIPFKAGDKVRVIGNPDQISTKECISTNYTEFVRDVTVGNSILFDDGAIELKVDEKTDDALICTVQNDGVLGSKKSVNVPEARINLPSLTEKDKHYIQFAIDNNLDFIAHSFVRNKRDLQDIQEILDAQNSQIKIISKIENQEGVDNIDEILEHCYGVMIARGDLGIEVPMEKIPSIQRMLINKCVKARKPVIVATQLLHTMQENPRPTRAEVSDIAIAVYGGTDAVMLSGETASGDYPIESIKMMTSVVREAESTKISNNNIPVPSDQNDITAFLASAAVAASAKVETKAIINDCESGKTARCLSAYRGDKPVLAFCYHERTMRELALSYGVFPEYKSKTENYLQNGLKELVKDGFLNESDFICSLSGCFGSGLGTTTLEINRVSKIMLGE